MNMSFNQSINFYKNNKNILEQLSNQFNEIIICPSFDALATISALLTTSTVKLGAQNCSEYPSGAYTGEVSVQSLAEIGITHCIVGHSERRTYFKETIETISKKIALLYQYKVQPIICIGQTTQAYQSKNTPAILEQQLASILTIVPPNQPVIIAYEPVFAIGTGMIPQQDHLENTFTWLAQYIKKNLAHNSFQLLYGGSVNPTTINTLKSISCINGFLIGSAGTDREKLQKIISEQ